jgi:undecaprenyl-diphosphatase
LETLFKAQLEFIRSLHQIRHPFLDNLIKLFDFFDRQEFLFILIPIIWLGFGWKFGMRLFYLLALSHVVNFELKNLFALPRPFHLDPTLGIIQVSGYGFPSGAAQTALLLSGLLVIYWRSKWRWVIAAIYTLSISFSRIYLGVHFPIDIVGGWIVGFLLLGVYLVLFPKVERFFEQRSPLQALLISSSLLIALMFAIPSENVISICACAIGLGIGAFISRLKNLNSIPKTKWEFGIRILIGITGVFLIYNLAAIFFNLDSLIPLLLLFTAIGLWISFGALYLCKLTTRS